MTSPQFKIDSDKPIPPAHGSKYPFRDLKIGQSFFIPGQTSTGRVANAARNLATRSELKFTLRAVTEGGIKGVRIWRLE